MENKTIRTKPNSGSLGAKITGIDLAKPLSEEAVSEIKGAWHDHGVVFFPDQDLDPAKLETFTQSMGDFGHTDFIVPMEGHPNVLELRREPEETASHFGSGWHTDYTFQEKPPAATILFGHIVPPVGGDTLYADGRAAYLALSSKMQTFLEGLRAVHSAVLPYSKEGFYGQENDPTRSIKIIASDEAKDERSHPIIRTHPETGEKILWVNRTYTIAIEDLSVEESKALLDFLCAFSTQDKFVYRHRWQKNMLTMWDNRRVQHFADAGFDGHRRVMWRTTTAGTVPV
jgi:alpha-ketoglutarate-dependent taurine dioxygenase